MDTALHPLRVGIIASNYLRIHENVRKGTEIFVYTFANALKADIDENNISMQVQFFASGNSDIPFPITSVRKNASVEDPNLSPSSYKLMEMALFAKAFEQKNQFDLFHVHVSNGEWLLPFIRASRIPTLITMHGGVQEAYDPNLYLSYLDVPEIHYVSISNNQRKRIPDIQYNKTIYHGINTTDRFTFSEGGGEYLMWAGRGIPEKGLHNVIAVYEKMKKPTQVFPIVIDSHLSYLSHHLLDRIDVLKNIGDFQLELNLSRQKLIPRYQNSKAFLFPLCWEEPFGLVMAESLACGTPIIAYARGSTTEIVNDGVTGFLVNSSDTDIRGSFITKKTGIEGFCEAVEHLYTLSHEEYRRMRKNCREDAENRFSTKPMISQYVSLYQEIADLHRQ